jgi:hypothetical protein
MSLMDGLKKDDNIKGESDSLGGSFIKESGIYPVTVDMAYLDKSKAGALGLFLHFKCDDGTIIKHTLYVTSNDSKGNKPYYVTKRGDKAYLPGYNQANALSTLCASKELSECEEEDKKILIYNFDAKKEIPTFKSTLPDLMGQSVKVGLIKQVVDKNVKNDNGEWVASGETKEENEIDKFFDIKTDQTVIEVRGNSSADLMPKWLTKWKGVTKQKATGGGKTGAMPGAPVVASIGGVASPTPKVSTPTKSIFENN